MYVERDTEVRSRNHCCRGEAISITYLCVCVRACVCKCVCLHVALLIQHVTRMRHIVTSIWPL
jgi:hypothetical protein